MVEDENLAQTWYVFWILPVLVIGLNLALIPKYNTILHTQRFLRGYIVIVYALLLILALFYSMFLMMANILNKNKKLQQENLFLSVQQERYENLRSAIEEARQARHDIRHHFIQLSAMAKDGDLEKIKEYLQNAMDKIPTLDYHFCENQSVDNVIGYYYALAQKEEIPFAARVDLPKELFIDEMDLCLILSNLLENALEASRKTTAAQQQISLEIYQHSASILLIRVENNFDGNDQRKEPSVPFHQANRTWESVPSLSAEWQKRTMVLVILLMKMESLPQRLCFALTFKRLCFLSSSYCCHDHAKKNCQNHIRKCISKQHINIHQNTV
ncbi:MAG: sensor histidine kinase [Lachnospiraceae bacterium]